MSSKKMETQLLELQQQTQKLKDYLLRSYQLVTLLVGQGETGSTGQRSYEASGLGSDTRKIA